MTLVEWKMKGILGYYLEASELGGGMWLYFAAFALLFVGSYFLGSLNFGIIIAKYRYHDDVRTHGSGNAGTTNMMRTYGKSAAGITLLGDCGKTVVAILISCALCGKYAGYLAGLGCLIGHVYPCFFGFKGGKGVAVTAATVLMMNPIVFLILFAVFAIIVGWTKFISLGSVMCMILYPMLLANIQKILPGGSASGGRDFSVVIAFITAIFVIWLHRENIKRLYEGKENKFSFKKSVKPEESKEEAQTEAQTEKKAKKKH